MEQRERIDSLLSEMNGDDAEHCFRVLYNLLYDRFFRIAIYYLKIDEWAQEVVIDVFLVLWNKRNDLSKISNFENYYFILLKNASLNYLSKNKQIAEPLDSAAEITNKSTTPEDDLLNEELLLIYINTLDELPPRCREVFVLVREQGLSYKDVAEQLNISPKTVDAQLQKAVSILKEKINSYFS